VKCSLEAFDTNWVSFEQLYVIELMLIEADARRFITDCIEVEKELILIEVKEKSHCRIVLDCELYNKYRGKMVDQIGKINSVANIEGKGRDDLKVDILFAAEGITRRISSCRSRAVKQLAERIKSSFSSIRILMRRYEQNIEIVDPQLKNNSDLVDALVQFETSWEKGNTYFLNSKRCNQLMFFSELVESLTEKYPLL
jgi:hypothetical protein